MKSTACVKFHFPPDLKRVRESSMKVLKQLAGVKCTEKDLFNIRLCFEEALINAIKYGQKKQSSQDVDVELTTYPDHVELAVWDNGAGFDFDHCPDPTLKENLTKTHGRGVYLIKKLMDRAVYEKDAHCLRMAKYLS